MTFIISCIGILLISYLYKSSEVYFSPVEGILISVMIVYSFGYDMIKLCKEVSDV
jgi:hypothetical protein